MRTVFLFLLAGVALSAANLVDLHVECPEQEVPDLSRICIKPNYIEGCLAYKTTKECDECSKGTFLSIQITKPSTANVASSVRVL